MISNRIRLITTTVSKRPMLDTRCLILDQTQTAWESMGEDPVSLQLRSRMKLPMHSFQSLLVDVRIDLRRRDIGVAAHFLDDAQICAVPQDMCRGVVSKKIRLDVLTGNFRDARLQVQKYADRLRKAAQSSLDRAIREQHSCRSFPGTARFATRSAFPGDTARFAGASALQPDRAEPCLERPGTGKKSSTRLR